MEERFKNLIESIKQHKLTSSEKTEMFKKINAFVEYNPERKHSYFFYHTSPFVTTSPFQIMGRVAVVMILFMIVSFGGLSYASALSLPGDFLYSFKLHREKIEEGFANTPEKRIALRQKRIETRYKEVETLIKEKKITKEKITLVQSKIEVEKEKATSDLVELKQENTEAAKIAENSIEASIEEHKETIISLVGIKPEETQTTATMMTTTENTLVPKEEPEENTDFYGNAGGDLDITEEDINILLNTDSNIGEDSIKDESNLGNIEVVPQPTLDIVPPTPLQDPVNSPTTEVNNQNKTNNN